MSTTWQVRTQGRWHYHDSTGTESKRCWCSTPRTYAPAAGSLAPGQVVRKPRGMPGWAYVLDIPGEWPYVSAYRYRTEAEALAAGRADAESCAALIAEGITS